MIIFDHRFAAPGLWNANLHFLCSQLQQITITGYDRHLHTLLLTARRQCTQNIICLIAFLRYRWNLHGFQHLFDHRYLFPEFLRHRMACTLICLIHLVPERWRMKIKGYRQILRLFLIQNPKHNI